MRKIEMGLEGERAEPLWLNDSIGGFWSCPEGYKFPSCSGCGHRYYRLKPRESKGGASVPGPLCQWCERELERL